MPGRPIIPNRTGRILVGRGGLSIVQIQWLCNPPRIGLVGVRVVARSIRGAIVEVVPLLISAPTLARFGLQRGCQLSPADGAIQIDLYQLVGTYTNRFGQLCG